MCHTNVAGNVPDNVPEILSESEALRHGKPDHQGYCTDQRLLCQHHLPCDQRQAGCPPGDQGARSEGDAGGRVRAQHQRPTAEDPAVPQSGVRSKRHPEYFLLGFSGAASACRHPVRVQRHRLLLGRERQRDRRRRKDPAGDQAQRHHLLLTFLRIKIRHLSCHIAHSRHHSHNA